MKNFLTNLFGAIVLAIGFMLIANNFAQAQLAPETAPVVRHFKEQEVPRPICVRIPVADYAMEQQGYEFVDAVGDYRMFRHANGNRAIMQRKDTPWQPMECLIRVGDPDWTHSA